LSVLSHGCHFAFRGVFVCRWLLPDGAVVHRGDGCRFHILGCLSLSVTGSGWGSWCRPCSAATVATSPSWDVCVCRWPLPRVGGCLQKGLFVVPVLPGNGCYFLPAAASRPDSLHLSCPLPAATLAAYEWPALSRGLLLPPVHNVSPEPKYRVRGLGC
jgi:hypothetical protein